MPSTPAHELPPGVPKEGDVLADKFVVERVIGAGGMGVVLAARHRQLGQRVAVKILHPDAASDGESAGRFVREARAAATLQGANVVRVTDVGTLPSGLPFMVMEHLAGSDLANLVEMSGPLPVREAVDYVLQACEALAEAHGHGIVHRDVKPSNLFLTRRPDGAPLVKVLDFGISKAAPAEGDKSLTTTQAAMGSPFYMSPEQLRSAKRVDSRTDLWALGVVLFELLAASVPFEDETMTGLCAKVMLDPPASLRAKRPDVPVELEAVVLKCLEKDVARRVQTVGELATALKPFASPEGRQSAERVARIAIPFRATVASFPGLDPGPAPFPASPASGAALPTAAERASPAQTPSTWQRTATRGRRAWWLWVVGAVAAAGLVAVGGWGFLASRRSLEAVAPGATVGAPSPSAMPTSSTTLPALPPPSTTPGSSAAATGVATTAGPSSAASSQPAAGTRAIPRPAPRGAPRPAAPTGTAGLLDDRK